MQAPAAEIISQSARRIRIQCPYCNGTHDHMVLKLGQTERFSPGCALFRTPNQRAIGYTFTTTRHRRNAAPIEEGTA